MNSQFNARNKATQKLSDARWLQFSIKRVSPSGGDFQNTLKTKQHRIYNESCWETLARSTTGSERQSKLLKAYPPRTFYPELALVAPRGAATPISPNLPGSARSDLDIIWEGGNLVFVIVLDRSGSMDMPSTKIENAKTAAKLLVDRADVGSAIGVISFSDEITTDVPITTIADQATRNKIKADIDTIVAVGGTSIGAAAQSALDLLQSPATPLGIKIVLLLSDGVSDDDALAPIPLFQDAQIPIFAFSYGDDADTATLRRMAELTKGLLYISPVSLVGVTKAFLDASTTAAGAANIATGSGTAAAGNTSTTPLTVDSSIGTLRVVVVLLSNPSSATVKLENPNRQLLEADMSSGVDLQLFTIKNPVAGQWKVVVTSMGMPVSYEYQVSGSPIGVTLTSVLETANGSREIKYPEPLMLVVSLGLGLPVLKANVEAVITAPDQKTTVILMNDEGTAPDLDAGDGLYSAAVNYDKSGTYNILVRVRAAAGVAVEDASYLQPSAGEKGELVRFAPPAPLSETFERFDRIQVEVTGVMADDHGNTFPKATPLSADNTLVPGRIERAGDVDVFAITVPTGTKEIWVRISNVLFEWSHSSASLRTQTSSSRKALLTNRMRRAAIWQSW